MKVEGIVVYYKASGLYGGLGFIEVRNGTDVKQFAFRRFEVVRLPEGQQHPEVGQRVRFIPSLKQTRNPTHAPFAADVEILDASASGGVPCQK
jgi:hypothetical protein